MGFSVIEGLEAIRSMAIVPALVQADEAKFILIGSPESGAFDADTLRLLQTIGSAMSVALQSAQRFEQIQQRNAELAVINSVQAALVSKPELKEVLYLILGQIGDLADHYTGNIGLYDEARGMVDYYLFHEGEGIHSGLCTAGRVQQEGC